MVRKVPQRVKPVKLSRSNQGFFLDKQTRKDTVITCENCGEKVSNDDIYFECKACGPQGTIRIIRGGKLASDHEKRKGSSICLACAENVLGVVKEAGYGGEEDMEQKTKSQKNKIDELTQHFENVRGESSVFFVLRNNLIIACRTFHYP